LTDELSSSASRGYYGSGKDYDDLMAMVLLAELHRLGLVDDFHNFE
jgi:hypothetical protein